jgi:hypothetical protein
MYLGFKAEIEDDDGHTNEERSRKTKGSYNGQPGV